MRMYWRVFGPAWTPVEMDYQLDQLRQTGVGGVVVYFMYPFALDDPATGVKNLRFGSPEFLDSLQYAASAAKNRDLRFGLNGSTGWPYGGPTVSVQDSAQHIREEIHAPGVVPKKLAADESVVFETAVRRYIAGPTRMGVKRPAYGAEGLVVSHYDRGALDRYLTSVVEPMLKASDGQIKELGCDSLEVYGSNWTPDLPSQFKKRRGYDLVPHLPELFDPKSEPGKAVRFDFWRTLAELTEERFTIPLGDWCAKRGLNLEMEPYGTPPNPMTSSRYIQTPTGEHYEWKGFSVQRYVASAAHQAGRNIIGAEAWTWSGLPNRLADSLSDLKLVSDMTFLSGANDLTGVDFPYSPRSAGTPGWVPYYGPFMSPGNSQWPLFPTLVDYVNRCQWMLRQGEPVRRVAVYLPVEDSFREGPTEQMTLDFYVRDRLVTGKATSEFGLQNGLKHTSDLIHGLISAGLDYDGIDFWTVDRVAKVSKRALQVGPARYEAVILPNLATMDVEALRKVTQFCEAGGAVVVTRQVPTRPPGKATEGEVKEFEILAAKLFAGVMAGGRHSIGKGSIEFVDNDRAAATAVARATQPDVAYLVPPTTVGFQHRRSGDRDIYYFANVGPDPVHLTAKLNVSSKHLETWDALSGEIRKLLDGPEVTLDLAPRGSLFVVSGSSPDATPVRGTPAHVEWQILASPWSLHFEGPDAPPDTALQSLHSWTDVPGAKFFSGLGRYRTTFPSSPKVGQRVVLELGEVREAAEVYVNGRKLGVAIVPPFEVDITKGLVAGQNSLEVVVANLPVNRFIGLPRPDLKALRAVYGNRFPVPEEHELMKDGPAISGLIGPVRLRIETAGSRH